MPSIRKTLLTLCLLTLPLTAQTQFKDQAALMSAFHSISSHHCEALTAEQCKPVYDGRLTGTAGYDTAAAWVAARFAEWGISPAVDGSYYQYFDHHCTEVLPGWSVTLHTPVQGGQIDKSYQYVRDYMPGSTSDSGSVTAEVVYAGYGITAPELDYDDYAGMDVKGKIVLLEREIPVDSKNPEQFLRWRPYSFHQYKLENAVRHGARGMLYHYGPIANPNNSFAEGFVYVHVGADVVNDLFIGAPHDHEAIVKGIQSDLKPRSFATGKSVTIEAATRHHSHVRGSNVIGWLEGSDAELKDEVILLGAHLDHMGRCHELIPGANDNASGVAVVLETARALAALKGQLKRSVGFLIFGAEEQAVAGSEVYLDQPVFPLEKTVCLLNLDGVGAGTRLSAAAAENYPELFEFVKSANDRFVHRPLNGYYFSNMARPRLDAARFLWKNIPTLSFSAGGSLSYYHVPQDNMDIITPEIMEDLARVLLITVAELANADAVEFKAHKKHALHNRTDL